MQELASPLTFRVHAKDDTEDRVIAICHAVIAGWTGRDPAAVEAHISELAAVGVPRPSVTPIFYPVAASRLTTRGVIEVSGDMSSGEVEFVLIQAAGRLHVGVGSDHTDRKVEAYSVTVSKQMCDKPVAPELWNYRDVAPHWDRLILRSWAVGPGGRVLYQEGPVDTLRPPEDIIARFARDGLPDGTALFGGTLAVHGTVRAAPHFDFELEDPVLGRRIQHGYDVIEQAIPG